MKITEIKEAGVTRMEDDKWGYVPVAYVVLIPDTEEEIFDFLSTQLAKYKLPKKVFFVEELPRNASNKLLRNKLKEL